MKSGEINVIENALFMYIIVQSLSPEWGVI